MALAEAKVVPRLKRRYEDEIAPRLRERFDYKSPMQTPRLVKITVNMGVGDAKQDTNMLQAATEQLQTIAGQRPNIRRARKSIANFKLREEMPVGVAVTLRDARMWEFLDRLTAIAIPRIRDFRGLNPRGFDGRGNYNMGVREQIIFPEIDYDSVDQVRGMDIAITTTATTDEEAFALLSELGMPFRRDDSGGGPTAAELRAEQEAKAKAEAEQAALEQLKEENPEAYAKPASAPEAEGDEAAETPAEPGDDQET
jgi:large subunit ribosomal protein L5